MNYRQMFKVARHISKKTHRSFIKIFIDIIRCGLKYQAGYYDYMEFEFYELNDEQRATYLTRGKNNAIIKRYNDKDKMELFDDKVRFNKIFESYLNRDCLSTDEASFEEFEAFVKKHPTFIAKPADGLGGDGVEKYDPEDYTDAHSLLETLKNKKQNLLEEFVIQHPDLNELYPGSLNTIRMFTFFKDGEGHFLQAILKFGNGGEVDNFSSGGMYTFANDDGIVTVPAIDKEDKVYYKHPMTGKEIVGFKIPMFKEAVELVEKAATVIPEMGYVGWDVGIGVNGPVIIEGNCYPGVFQKRASLSDDKTGVIPKYRQYMDI